MADQIGSFLCLMTIPFGVVNSFWHLIARHPHPRRYWFHLVNLVLAAFFVWLARSGSSWGASGALLFLRLWLPIVYYWWAYAWAGTTLHLFHERGFSFDRALITAEQRWFGNPSLWMARGKPRWLNELMNFSYWSYYLYTPVVGVALYAAGQNRRFEAMAMAVSLGYAVCYSIYPWYPLWGPRWALVSEDLLPAREQILDGYVFTAVMNRIMWSDTPHKGGAMPSAHSATCVIFMLWCWRIWGTEGAVVGGLVGAMMLVSTVYGRYHYAIDVIVGSAIGLLAVWGADLLVAG